MDHNSRLISDLSGKLTGPGIVVTDGYDATLKSETLISNVIGVLTIVAVIYFVLQIIFAGYAFINSQGDVKTMETSRKRLTEAVLGLFFVVVAVGFGSLMAYLLGLQNVFRLSLIFHNMGL